MQTLSARNLQGLVAGACRLGNCMSSRRTGERTVHANCRTRRHPVNIPRGGIHTRHRRRIRHPLRNRTSPAAGSCIAAIAVFRHHSISRIPAANLRRAHRHTGPRRNLRRAGWGAALAERLTRSKSPQALSSLEAGNDKRYACFAPQNVVFRSNPLRYSICRETRRVAIWRTSQELAG
jgi:hypothetical protein